MKGKLPAGWVEITLADHIYIAGRIGWRGLKADEYTSSGPILLSVPNLNHGDEVDFGRVNHITEARYNESSEIQVTIGDTLLVKDGAGIGKLGYVASLPGPATVNSSLLVVRSQDGLLLHKYLFYYLKGPELQNIAQQRITGSATPHLFQKDIKRFNVLVPPLAEQNRIVGKVDAVLARVRTSLDHLEDVPKTLKRFRRSVLAASCSGRLTAEWRGRNPTANGGNGKFDGIDDSQPSGWKVSAIRPLIQRLDQGWSPKCEIEPSSSPEVWGVIKTTAVQPLDFLERENKKLPANLEPRPDLELRAGDILITRAGPRARAGICALVNSVRPRLMICDKVYRVRTNRELVLPEFLVLALNTPSMMETLDTLKTGISDSGVNLTQDKFCELRIQLPPLDEQKEIVRCAQALFAFADRLDARLKKATVLVDRLTQSILAKAFRGELVLTEAEIAEIEGRTFESAGQLLSRIRDHSKLSGQESTPRRNRRTSSAS